MKSQKDLIGDHPVIPNIFGKWLACTDVAVTSTKVHRSLTGILSSTDTDLIDWLGRKLFNHHHSEYRIDKLLENYSKLGYPAYAEQHRKLPIADKTKKGNATEIILTEYLEGCFGKSLIKVFKLKYNPNVDQAIKGDDTLMVDIVNDGKSDKVKVYLGEAKFRKSPSSTVVKTIAKSLAKDKKPLSYSFLIDELGRDPVTRDLADKLDTFLIDEIKGKGDLIYTGLLLSDEGTYDKVETYLDNDNPEFVFISIGINNPEDLITEAFIKAETFVTDPTSL